MAFAHAEVLGPLVRPGAGQNIAKDDQSSFAGIRARTRLILELSNLNCCWASVTIDQACQRIATGHNDPLRRPEIRHQKTTSRPQEEAVC
jgi:hypothetical protein